MDGDEIAGRSSPGSDTAGGQTRPAGSTVDAGRYRVDDVLGRGAFGTTYRAFDTKLGRFVALKELAAPGAAVRERFLAEACALARFTHAGIVRVHDVIDDPTGDFVVMELVRGRSLADMIAERGALPAAEALPLIEFAGEALRAVHEAGYVHRDVKPENIIAADDGRVVLLDFGAARTFLPGDEDEDRLLTPGYAPPEQYRADARLGPAADIYALGATAYHLLTGRPPQPAPDRQAGLKLVPVHHLAEDTPRGLSDAIAWALELQPEDRPQSARDLVLSLRNRGGAGAADGSRTVAITPTTRADDVHTTQPLDTRNAQDWAEPAAPSPPRPKRVVLPLVIGLAALSSMTPVLTAVVWVLGLLPIVNAVAATRRSLDERRYTRGTRWWDTLSAPPTAILRWLWSLVVALFRTFVVLFVIGVIAAAVIVTIDAEAAEIGDVLRSGWGRLGLAVVGGLGLGVVVPLLLRSSDAYVRSLPRIMRVRRDWRMPAYLVAVVVAIFALVTPLSLWPVTELVKDL